MTSKTLASLVLFVAPVGAFASSGASSLPASQECDRLISVLERRAPSGAHDLLQTLRVYRDGNRYQACLATARLETADRVLHNVSVGRLLDMEIFNGQGAQIGDVERVVLGDDQRTYILTTYRGPRWPGNKQVALPAHSLVLDDGRLIVSGLGEDELHRLPSVHQDSRSYTELGGTALAEIAALLPSETGSTRQNR